MAMEYLLNAVDMEPPEPFVRTMEMIQDLQPGDYLRLRHRREPFPLYDNLNQSGFSFITCTGGDVEYDVFIWSKEDAGAQAAAQSQIQLDKLTIYFSNINNPHP